MHKKNKSKFINSFTGARFFAIIIITISHLDFLKNDGLFGKIYGTYLHNATLGVDFFFMLSGFGMMLSYMRKSQQRLSPKSSIEFGIRHVRKIYPLYITTCLVMLPFYVINGITQYGDSVLKLLLKALIYLGLDITLLQSATGVSKISRQLNGVGWFLSTLFIIYILSPYLMAFLKKYVKNTKQACTGIVFTIVLSTILAVIFDLISNYTIFDDLTYGTPYRRFLYVVCGMLLAQCYLFEPKIKSPEILMVILNTVWFFAHNKLAKILGVGEYPINMLLAGGLLYSLSYEQGKISDFLSSSKMRRLGNLSMYIFLIHFPVIMWLNLGEKILHLDGLVIDLIVVFLDLVLTFWLSEKAEKIMINNTMGTK